MSPPNCLLAVLALTVFLGANNALPITSRPIEGNVQRMVWEDWVNLDPEQRNLTKEKKITAKSIFTLPFRHCPQGHTLFNQLCIPQSNIDPTDLVKQELILAGGSNGSPPPPPIGDYDYGDDEESEEIVYDLSVIPIAMQDGLPSSVGAGDQALPSEDAPLKFNIFEKKFATGTGEPEELPLPPDMAAATYVKNISSTAETSTSTTPTSTATVALPFVPSGEASNRIPGGDLLAAPSDAFSTSTTLTMPTSNTTTTSNKDIGQVESIVLPAEQEHDGPVHLVSSSLTDNDSDDSSTALNEFNAEADLAQLLKVDAFLPVNDGSIELVQPLFSHRKVAPPLSADQDVKTKHEVEAAEKVGAELEEEEGEGEVTATNILPSEEDEYTTETATTTGDSTVAEELMDTSTATSTSGQSSPHPPEEPEIDERENRLVLIKSKVQPVQLTTTASATAADAADSSSSTDRFHYQHFVEDEAASSTTTATPEPSSSTPGDPIEQSDMPASDNDNLMTNTIGGRGDDDNDGGHKATSEIDVQQELRLINELVKGKQGKQHQSQKQELEPTSTEITSASTSTTTEDATTTAAYTNWSKVMPQLGQSTSETAATTETVATSSGVNESSLTATSASTEVKDLSITNRSYRNSKIIRVDRLAEEPEGIVASAASTESAATAATPPNSSSNPDGYTPFWWLPSIGWRLDRHLDGNGEDQSLLLRFFSTFRGSNTVATTR
ncbi:protein folded gastrulation [Drosophila mauritiana]|uniref:Protein folded gastrulation n=4 Tax=Drosophila mauritiana TaxID=7226 RepID=A0A6P8KVL2_DROMA|nr:protein folded gastrulation [Drosophila mauritiana]XP_033170712.1 protein folded gastrulation [Drosophila mauritiana]XP_033170713.1 protein folded gastrulation [Drosophila mauritiana]XP_033170714.1 protein folded gastrulation [Drosophila mauritiana]XP_033170715.1 protein folded gastrulation [Drosophila mauritiana]